MAISDRNIALAAGAGVLLLVLAGIGSCGKSPEIGKSRPGTQNAVSSAAEEDFDAINWNDAKAFTDSASLEAYLQQCFEARMPEIKVISVEKPPGSGMFLSSTGMLRAQKRSWTYGYGGLGDVYYAIYTVQYAMGAKILAAHESGDTTSLSDTELLVYSKAREFVDALSPGYSDYTKEKYIHDYICKITTYYSDETTGTAADFRTAEGVLLNGRANCMGYSDAFVLLCGLAGLEVETDRSNAISHMWNVITLDGNKYLVDVTWDDGEGKKYDHQYFNAGKDKMGAYVIEDGSLSEEIVEKSDKFYGGF